MASGGYWELMLASTLDFPMQSRVIEIVDEGNGYASVYVTNAAPGGLADVARQLGAAKLAFGGVLDAPDVAADREADTVAQNLLLRIPLPPRVAASLAAHPSSATIESEDTLAALQAPPWATR